MTWTLDDLLPHRAPMVFLDAVESLDPAALSITATVSITPAHVLYSPTLGGVPNWSAIEFMAQAAAALVGCYDKERDPARPVRPGLLLGTRRLDLRVDAFVVGRTYRVTAANTFWDNETAAFACTIVDDAGAVVAEASLNAFRPPDFGAFIKEQSET